MGGELRQRRPFTVAVRPKATTVETILARIAGANHGIVTREEMLDAGITRGDDFRRFTWDDVNERPDALVAELRDALRRREVI